jgi:hypothetical protein
MLATRGASALRCCSEAHGAARRGTAQPAACGAAPPARVQRPCARAGPARPPAAHAAASRRAHPLRRTPPRRAADAGCAAPLRSPCTRNTQHATPCADALPRLRFAERQRQQQRPHSLGAASSSRARPARTRRSCAASRRWASRRVATRAPHPRRRRSAPPSATHPLTRDISTAVRRLTHAPPLRRTAVRGAAADRARAGARPAGASRRAGVAAVGMGDPNVARSRCSLPRGTRSLAAHAYTLASGAF